MLIALQVIKWDLAKNLKNAKIAKLYIELSKNIYTHVENDIAIYVKGGMFQQKNVLFSQ